MKRIFERVAATVMGVLMAFSIGVTPVFAETHNNRNSATMNPKVTVYEIGRKSFYKVNDDGSIVYADRQEDAAYKAVPSKYIDFGEYWDGINHGFYTVATDDGYEVHVVSLADCIKDGGAYYYDHGTKVGATVSEEVDTATNQDPSMSTDFYINIEDGIDPDGIPTEGVKVKASTEDRVKYEITVATKTTYQLNATVPMYVCMYGYRGTGNVVTPTQDAYQMKNYSTYNENTDATITELVMLTQYTQLLDQEHSDENIHTIAYTRDGGYEWWYSAPTINTADYVSIMNLDDNGYHINASGENYVIFIDGNWYIAAAGTLENGVLRTKVNEINAKFPLVEDFEFNNWNFGKEFAVGDKGEWTGDERVAGLPIKVTSLQAEPATWKLIDAEKKISEIKRGELIMTLAPEKASFDSSAIDLSDCSAPLDISDRGWFLGAPKMNGEEVEAPTILGLKTFAQMAGGNVNASGCTPVVKVTYTIIPILGETGLSEKVITSI